MQRLSEEEKAAYNAFMRVVFAVPRVVTADMTAARGLGLSDHMVLGNPAGRLARPDADEDLAGRVRRVSERRYPHHDQARRRRPDGSGASEPDARGAVAVLTPAGAELFEQACEIHLASVRRTNFRPAR